ncbi:hypothetical protein LP417_35235 (plasmid) [Polaromonas sp. P1-6]|nr:hypothetical protein LP417_35235 [Polaromonas sp. P1-6]
MNAQAKPKVDVALWISNATRTQLNKAITRLRMASMNYNEVEAAKAEDFIMKMEYELLGRALTTLLA